MHERQGMEHSVSRCSVCDTHCPVRCKQHPPLSLFFPKLGLVVHPEVPALRTLGQENSDLEVSQQHKAG